MRTQSRMLSVLGSAAGLMVFAMHFAAEGQTEKDVVRYALRNWQTQDGLPHNSVHALTQSSDGYLWIGTANGLARFEGMRFIVFNSENTLPLKSDSIKALAAGKDGTVWIGTDHGGLLAYRRGAFDQVDTPINHRAIRALWTDGGDTLWVGTTNGLGSVESGRWKTATEEGNISAIQQDREGTIWLAAPASLRRLRQAELTSVEPQKTRGARALTCAQDGAVWVGARGTVFRVANGILRAFSQPEGLPAEEINALHEDRGGTVWLGHAAGLAYLGLEHKVHEVSHEGGPLDVVFCILEDREGNVWAGARDGLYRLTPKLFVTFGKEHGLRSAIITSVQGRTDKLWIGTWGGGLHYLEEGKIAHVPFTNEHSSDLILGLFVERNGTVWFGADGNAGMFRFDNNRTLTRYWQGEFSNLADTSQRVIMLERQNPRIWVGTPRGLNVATRRQPFWRYTVENGLPSNNILALIEDAHGDVWIGTDGGLTQFKQDGNRTTYTIWDGLPGNTITALYEDDDNNLWIGTTAGLCRRRHETFTCYTARQGLFSDQVFEIVEDNFQRLWMTCSSGIFWVAKSDFDALGAGQIHSLGCVSYGKNDGLLTVACSSAAKPSAWKTPDGRLWFATVKGLSVVDPGAISRVVRDPPAVLVETILWDRESYKPANDVALPPGDGELEFEFTALSFLAPERNRFKYRLDGLDSDWNDAGVRRSARYNNVPPGEYRFVVVACNSAGVWNETGASVQFAVRPHYWQSLWFKLAMVGVVGIGIVTLYRLRVARLRAIERMRLRIASDLHDEIGSSIGSIALLAQKVQKEAQLSRGPEADLASIQRIAIQSANSIRDIVWFINPQYDTMQDLLLRMKEAAVALLAGMDVRFTPPQDGLACKLSPEFRRNIFLIFKEVLGNILKHSKASRVEIDAVDNNGLWMLLVRDNGVGFDPEAIRRGNGLNNLRHRAEKLRGSIEIRSQPGSGTTIVFTTRKPLHASRGMRAL